MSGRAVGGTTFEADSNDNFETWVSISGRCVRLTYRRAEGVRRAFMVTQKYRTVVAAVLAGAVLFSPLVCGMTCLEARVSGASAGAEVVQPAEELVAGFAERAVIGCLLTRVVSKIDVSEWTERVDVERLIWVGVEAERVFDRVW
jgi:hypothetical protein